MNKTRSQLVAVFDTSICDNNLGNQIIMEAVNEQLEELFPQAFFLRLPYLDSIGAESQRYAQESEHVFLGGTNALSAEMEIYRQWGLDETNYRNVRDVLLLGVGWWQYQDQVSDYTKTILTTVLHDQRLHSVRDSYTKDKLAEIGIHNVVVTGCPSMWRLTKEHCGRIPTAKAWDVLLTFTNYSQDASDRELYQTLRQHYRNVHVWVQGPEDLAYARDICGAETRILDPNLRSLDHLLREHPSLDYVGTRLHAGIRALCHGRRSLIIGVDNRATEKGKDFGLPVLDRADLAQLPETIEADRPTEIRLPHDAIQQWKQQFCSPEPPVADIAPVSRQFGFDRGEPIDRYYIERFLDQNRHRIRGRVLEVADDTYARKFGSNIERIDILNAVPSDGATIVGQLEDEGTLPASTFDCIILTQTLNVLYDPKAAIRNASRALRPGGTLLITAPGISQVSRYDMDRWGDFWRFTDRSMGRMLADNGLDNEVLAHGNVVVAKAFLDGLARHEVEAQALQLDDPDYQLLLTACATRPAPVADDNPLVLIYHRVAADPVDAQLLSVSPRNFDEQMAALARSGRAVPLDRLLANPTPGQVAITFDDGYLNVLENGLPILERHGLHATLFVTTGPVGTDREFWWDELERILLTGCPLPKSLPLDVDGQDEELSTETPADRVALYDRLCSEVRGRPPGEVDVFLEGLREWTGSPSMPRRSHRILDEVQLRRLDASPAIEIGAHTVNHPSLAKLSATEQEFEIRRSKATLEHILGHPVRYFSYPFGSAEDFDATTEALVRDAGFEAGIANIQGSIGKETTPTSIPRRLVRNWTGAQFDAWLRSDDMSHLEQQTVSSRVDTLVAVQQARSLT